MEYQQPLTENNTYPAELTEGRDQIASFALYGKPFSLIQGLHPIASKVMTAAMDEAQARNGRVTRTDMEASLATTLVPYARRFYRSPSDNPDDDAALSHFAEMTQDWAFNQARSAATATVLAQLARFREDISGELVQETEWARLAELRNLVELLPDYTELEGKRRSLVNEIAALADSIASRAEQGNRNRPAVLSHILGLTDRGLLKPLALAALITSGNSSVGREHTESAVQVLTPTEAAELLGTSKRRLVDRVSDIRKKAAAAPHRVKPGRHVLRGEDLWIASSLGATGAAI